MSVLSAQEQAIFDVARSTLPREYFQDDTAAQEIYGAAAKVFQATRAQLDYWFQNTFLQRATGIWLDQHARDRGTQRQPGETDASMNSRLPRIADVVTSPVLTSAALAILAASGYSSPLPYPGMVELTRDQAFLETVSATGRKAAYLSRGYRAGHAGLPAVLIVILPYGALPAVGAAILSALQTIKPAGLVVRVETRLDP